MFSSLEEVSAGLASSIKQALMFLSGKEDVLASHLFLDSGHAA